MVKQSLQQRLGGCARHEQCAPTLIMLAATVLLLAWWYFGRAANPQEFAGFRDPVFAAGVYEMLAAFVLLGVIPALIVVLVLRHRAGDYGLRIGDPVKTFRSAAVSIPFFVLAGYLASGDPSVRAAYPLNAAAGGSAGAFAVHVATYLLFYVGWEFMFRGFLLFGLAGQYGLVAAVMIQAMASSLIHVGKPPMEAFLAIPVGIYWGWLALRTRSILSPLLQHAALGIALDAFIVFG
ncbi:MAG: CPBP family intramembrane glutamic endopeptidase [Pirellulales bacterium]